MGVSDCTRFNTVFPFNLQFKFHPVNVGLRLLFTVVLLNALPGHVFEQILSVRTVSYSTISGKVHFGNFYFHLSHNTCHAALLVLSWPVLNQTFHLTFLLSLLFSCTASPVTLSPFP